MDLRELPSASFKRHPWEEARADFFAELVGRHAGTAEPVTALDIGAGDGYLARRLVSVLPQGSRVACFDPNYTEAHIEAFSREAPAGITFTRERPTSPVAWLLLLDVIEHVPDDRAFLRELVASALVRGGDALISVPAWPALFSQHDEVLGHYRRYRPTDFAAVVAGSGLVVEEEGSLFSSLLLPRAASKAFEVLRGRRAVAGPAPAVNATTQAASWRGGRVSTAAIRFALRADAHGARALARAGLNLPGLTLWTRARKR